MKAILLALVLLPFSLLAQQEPVLRWAADPDSNAPYSFFGSGDKLTGFEYEIITAIAREMGRKPQFVQNDWDGLIPGLGRGLYDVVICGIEITPDKAGEVLFSNPYYVTFEQLVVRKGTPPINNLDQLKSRAIGTLDQTAALSMLEKTPGVEVKTYSEEVNAYQDTAIGRISWSWDSRSRLCGSSVHGRQNFWPPSTSKSFEAHHSSSNCSLFFMACQASGSNSPRWWPG